MMRTLAALLLFLLLPNMALAMEVTSPFGWRTHPITGKQTFHNGIDIAGDYGDAIPAVASGTVTSAGFNDGYGLYVSITAADGSETGYAHCAELYVTAGQQVTTGQSIAAIGSTGNSTGPHLHFEFFEPYSGRPSDPMPLLMAAGWDLTYGGAPAWDGTGWANSDTNDMPYDFGSFYDVARLVRTTLEHFTEALITALSVLTGQAMQVLQLLMVIDFAIAALLWAIGQTEFDLARFFTKKMIGYGFFVWLVANWRDFALTWILKSFVAIGTIGSGSSIAADELSDPSRIIQKGADLLEPLFAFIAAHSGIWALANMHHIILAMLMCTLIFACFTWIGLQFLWVYLAFYINAVFALILAPWGVNRFTKFISEGALGGLITQGIRIMAMTFVVAVVMATLTAAETPKYEHTVYLRVLFSVAGVAFLLNSVSATAMELFAGQPKL